jgi:hypothetical protein
MDAGTFELKSGTITLLGIVDKDETGAFFIGQGHFSLKPITRIDKEELRKRAGSETAEEDFSEAMFRFSGGLYTQFSAALGRQAEPSKEAAEVLERWRSKLRHRHEVPEGFSQAILEDATRGRGRNGRDLQFEASSVFQRVHEREAAQGSAVFCAYKGRRNSATRFAGRSGVDQLQRRRNGRWGPAETRMTHRETFPRWFTRGPVGTRNSTTSATNKARTRRSIVVRNAANPRFRLYADWRFLKRR